MTRFLISCLLIFSAGICFAENPPANTLLWQISGNGLTKPSYVFGTLHLICAKDFVWNTRISQCITNSDKVCFELDLDDTGFNSELAAGLQDSTGSGSIKEVLSAEQYQKLQKFLSDSMRMNLSAFDRLNPVELSSLLLVKVLSCGMPVSYELKIQEEAQKGKKEIVGLEQVSEQLSVLDSLPAENAGKELMDLIDSLPLFRAEYSKMVSLYKQQNLDELCQWVAGSDLPWEPMNVLLDDRNQKWIQRMRNHMQSGPVFFAVGAAHLCGPNGLIVLLRKAGYTMTPLN